MNWIKQNKLTFVLILLVFVLGFREFAIKNLSVGFQREVGFEGAATKEMALPSAAMDTAERNFLPPSPDLAPVETEERLVVEESSLSLVVKDVRESANRVVDLAKEAGGFMVSQNLIRPEEAPFATVVVRVPADKLDTVLEEYRNLSVKVSSENIKGTDVTDQYVNIQARLETLEKTKTKFETILENAVSVQDTLQVQRELINLQVQIDNLYGQKDYFEKTSKLALVTVYLSTDELALPYSPGETFRPAVVFKYAVRALVLTLRSGLTAIIWVAVYGAIWVPLVLVIWFIRRKRRQPRVP